MQDPELIDKSAIGDGSRNPFTEGLYIVGLTREQVESIGSFFNQLYNEVGKSKKRQITRNATTMLKGAIFALGSRAIGNIEWKEHCAESLREMIHEWEGNGWSFLSDFKELYPSVSKSDVNEVYKHLKLHYQYFSGIAHHNAAGIMSPLRSLLENESLKLEDCYEENIFIERVKIFFELLNQIVGFSKSISAHDTN